MINRYTLPVALSFFIWSSWILPVRLLGLSSITISFYTTLFAGLFWSIFVWLKYRKIVPFHILAVKKLPYFLLLGLFFVLNMLTYLGALQYTDGAIAVLTHYTAPIFVAFLAPFFLQERITRDKVIALILSLVGFVIIFLKKPTITETFWFGTALGLLSGLFYALIIIIAKKLLQNTERFFILSIQNLIGSLLLLILYRHINFSLDLHLFLILLSLSLLYSVIASYMYITSLSRLEGIKVAIIGYIEPVGVILWGFTFFNEAITLKTIVGAFLILYAGYIVAKR